MDARHPVLANQDFHLFSQAPVGAPGLLGHSDETAVVEPDGELYAVRGAHAASDGVASQGPKNDPPDRGESPPVTRPEAVARNPSGHGSDGGSRLTGADSAPRGPALDLDEMDGDECPELDTLETACLVAVIGRTAEVAGAARQDEEPGAGQEHRELLHVENTSKTTRSGESAPLGPPPVRDHSNAGTTSRRTPHIEDGAAARRIFHITVIFRKEDCCIPVAMWCPVRHPLRPTLVCLILVTVLVGRAWAHGSSPACPRRDRLPHGWACLRGLLRVYDFARLYSGATAPSNQHALSVGGMLDLETHPFLEPHLGARVTFWDAQGLPGLENHAQDNTHFDPTLYGLRPVRALTQAYLSWRTGPWHIDVGDRILDTPWMSGSDSRMVPASYQGASLETEFGGWDFELLRVTRWKSRTSSDYSATTLYNSPGTAGIEGGDPVTAVGSRRTPGAFALGLHAPAGALRVGLWYYDFDEYARLTYGTLTGPTLSFSPWRPGWKIQALREWSSGPNLLGTPVDALGAGAELLVPTFLRSLVFTLAFDRIAPHSGEFDTGGIVSPYTAGYATDPLFTTSMIAGLVEKGPGSAVRLALTDRPPGGTTRIIVSWARYYTAPRLPDTSETDLDVTWWPQAASGRLSLRNRLGILTGLTPPSPLGVFVYERLMLALRF